MSADFWAGYLSGAAGIVIGNPLDLIKTRLQAGPQATANSPNAASSAESVSSINWRNAGNLGRGATAPILGYGALNAILFVSYNRALSLLGERDYTNPTGLPRVFAAGAVAGFATFVVSAPTELVKCRAQVYDSMPSQGGRGGALAARGGTVSSWNVARETWRAEGVKGFYHGGVVTGVRDAVGYAFYFWSYELSKRLITNPETDTQRQAALKVLLCGGLAGIVTWASIFPLDVIKTRVQVQTQRQPSVTTATRSPSPASSPSPTGSGERASLLRGSSSPSRAQTPAEKGRRMGAWEVTKHAYRTEGLPVFFRGLGVCSVRAFIVNAVQWAVYEWMMQLMRDSKP